MSIYTRAAATIKSQFHECGVAGKDITSIVIRAEQAEAVIKALLKQTLKKVICETVDENGIEYEFDHYRCPNCGNIIHQHYRKSKEKMKYRQNYCVNCGQKIDWEDKEIKKILKKVKL